MAKVNEKGFAPLTILGILALVGVGAVGTAAASDGARPGDALYSIDQATENVRLAFAGSSEAKARMQSGLALERLEEAQSLVNEAGRTAHLEEALTKAQTHLANAQTKAEEAQAQGKDVDEVLALLAENSLRLQENLADVYERVPEQAKPAIERAMEASQKGFTEAANAVSGQKRQELLNGSSQRLERVRERVQEMGVELPEVELPETEEEVGGNIPIDIPAGGP